MYEPQGCTSMHESLAAAEARWKEIASQRMERLFHLVLAAPIETATAAAP